MKVITVSHNEFDNMCADLHGLVMKSAYDYDVLIGIARAGVYVAEKFDAKEFYIVKSQRGGTAAKRGMVNSILLKMPAFFNCFLRMAESKILEWKDAFKRPTLKEVDIDEKLTLRLKEGGHKVLIVDDAVDSGRSLLSVVEAVRRISPENIIRTAVITVTRKKVLIKPDYALFRNSTLLRFPWAGDVCDNSKGLQL